MSDDDNEDRSNEDVGRRKPDLGHHPNLNKPPLRTGNPPETLAHREDAVWAGPTWAADRRSAGILMLVLMACILAVGIYVISLIW